MSPEEFSRRLLAWFDVHGRRDLPWQHPATPYRVWVSEIMLQQTQVATVIPYYQSFLERFPGVEELAGAELDEVLHLWSGLGYYARARNLHRAARVVCDRHGGVLPLDFDALRALPGVGPSTAGAILALATGQRHPILDGNVKRVLARFAAVPGWPGQAAVSRRLWTLSERYTPVQRVADHTQAMMDLGATVCTRARPRCDACPLRPGCAAAAQGCPGAFPEARPPRALPVRRTRMLLLVDGAGQVLLERRPPSGVWGGLWSLPECPHDADLARWCRARLGLGIDGVEEGAVMRHGFSHFHLDITPVRARVRSHGSRVMEGAGFVWYNTGNPGVRGLAAPVRRLLTDLATRRE